MIDLEAVIGYDKDNLKCMPWGVSVLLQGVGEYRDHELASLVCGGDPDAFVELTQRYMSLIRAKAASFPHTALESDDLYQEGLLGLYRAARTYDPDGAASFRTYAGVCISHQIIAAYRSHFRKKNLPLNSSLSLDDEESPVQEDSFARSVRSNPEALLIAQENLQIVNERIRRGLSRLEQQVLFLYLGGATYAEIAKRRGITPKAVDNAMQRVRRKLRDFSL